MEGKQKIHCTVENCQYNDIEKDRCTLAAIEIKPIEEIQTTQANESMCCSYENASEE